MSLILDPDLESLDLYMEVLRIVHHHPQSSVAQVFSHATLAMDTSSCQGALDSLVHQGLLSEKEGTYSITASGVQTLIPVKRDGKFPAAGVQSYTAILPAATPSCALHVSTKNGACTITKDGTSVTLSAPEMQQLWKKLHREADHHA